MIYRIIQNNMTVMLHLIHMNNKRKKKIFYKGLASLYEFILKHLFKDLFHNNFLIQTYPLLFSLESCKADFTHFLSYLNQFNYVLLTTTILL